MSSRRAGVIFFFLVLFPYVTPFNLEFDTQPWALIFALFYLFQDIVHGRLLFPKRLVPLVLFAVNAAIYFALFVILGFADLLEGVRTLSGYISMATLPYVAYHTFEHVKAKHLRIAIGIWLAVGITQTFIDWSFASQLTARFSGGGVRGANGLAPEPAWYGRWAVFCLVLNEFFYASEKQGRCSYWMIFCALVFQVIISFSGMGFVLVLWFICTKIVATVCLSKNATNIFRSFTMGLIVLLTLSMFAWHPAMQKTRAGILLSEMHQSPALLMRHGGINLRLTNPVRAIYGGLIVTHGLGFGIARKTEFNSGYSFPDWLSNFQGPEVWQGRVRGGLVSAIYEFGLIGIAYLLVIMSIMLSSIYRSRCGHKLRTASLISLLVAFSSMFIEGATSFPIFGYLLGIHLWSYHKETVRLSNRKNVESPIL